MPLNLVNKSGIAAALCLGVTGTAYGVEESGWLTRLRNQLTTDQTTMEQTLEKQQVLDADTQSALDEREYHRRLRAMHREAVLLSELNLAWIQDQLANWDCRLAEEQQAQVEERRVELFEAQKQAAALCVGLSDGDERQQAVCAEHRNGLSRALLRLDNLDLQYTNACEVNDRAASQFQPTTTSPLTGETPWQP